MYASPTIIRVIKSRIMRWVRHAARMGKMRHTYKILVGTVEGKRPRARPRRRWADNIRMNLTEIGWEGVEWIHLAQDGDQWRAHADTIMNLRVP
jgi:hypothetical protein